MVGKVSSMSFDLSCCFLLPVNSQVLPSLRGILSCIQYGLGKQNHFVESTFRIAIGRNADPLSTNQITSRRSCDLIDRAVFAAILAGFSVGLIIRPR